MVRKTAGRMIKPSDLKKGESVKDAMNRLAKESYDSRNKIVTTASAPIVIENTEGAKASQARKKKQDAEFKAKNDKAKVELDVTKNNYDFISEQKAKRDKRAEDYEKMKDFLMEKFGWNGVKPPMDKFIQKVEAEVGNNYHIYQDENGDVKEFQNENSFDRINHVLPFMKPLNNIGSKVLKETTGVDVDINDISKKVTDTMGNSYSKDDFDKKQSEIEAKNDKINNRRVAEKVLGEGITDLFRSPKQDYTKSSQRTLKEYGDKRITGLRVIRAPIVSVLNKVLDVLTIGNWSKKLEKYNFDQLYHLGLQIEFDNRGHTSSIIAEKNATVNISTSISNYKKDTQTMEVPLKGKPITINELMNNAIEKVGKEQFFLYANPVRNCQYFVLDVLRSSNLLNETIKNFVLQDLTQLFGELHRYLPKVMNTVTDLGARFEHAFAGNRKPIPKTKQGMINELQKLKKSELEEIYKNFIGK